MFLLDETRVSSELQPTSNNLLLHESHQESLHTVYYSVYYAVYYTVLYGILLLTRQCVCVCVCVCAVHGFGLNNKVLNQTLKAFLHVKKFLRSCNQIPTRKYNNNVQKKNPRQSGTGSTGTEPVGEHLQCLAEHDEPGP